MVAWTIQRVTGILLLAYLFLDVHTVSNLSRGPVAFDEAMATFASPFFELLEIGLLGVVVLHAFNGVRITLLDLGIGLEKQRHLFWVITIGLGLLAFLAGRFPYSCLQF